MPIARRRSSTPVTRSPHGAPPTRRQRTLCRVIGLAAAVLLAAPHTVGLAQSPGSLTAPSAIPPSLLPFDPRPADSPKQVIAHWHQVTLSDDNGLPPDDQQTQRLYNNEKLRHRPARFLPLRRPPRPGLSTEEWRTADAASDINLAQAIGIDVFMINAGILDTRNWRGLPQYIRMLKAARGLGADFAIAPNFDCVGGTGQSAASGAQAAENLLSFLRDAGELDNPHMARLDGAMLVGTWSYEKCAPAHWQAMKDSLADAGLPAHLMCIAHPGFRQVVSAAHDGACDSWGDWGTRTYTADPAEPLTALARAGDERRVKAVPTTFNHQDADDGRGWESRGSELMRRSWETAIAADVEIAQIVTWNDVMEGSAMTPSTGRQFAFYDMAAYYIAWFKAGTPPPIARDALYYVHRKHLVPANYPFRGAAVQNLIEVVAFLTAPGTIEIVTDAGVTRHDVPAGVHAVHAPMPAAGRPHFRLVRDGRPVLAFDSQFPVTPWQEDFQDAQYRAGGSLRSLQSDPARAGASCAGRGVEACLSPGLGEPVWLNF
jgi:hypothetical protein